MFNPYSVEKARTAVTHCRYPSLCSTLEAPIHIPNSMFKWELKKLYCFIPALYLNKFPFINEWFFICADRAKVCNMLKLGRDFQNWVELFKTLKITGELSDKSICLWKFLLIERESEEINFYNKDMIVRIYLPIFFCILS